MPHGQGQSGGFALGSAERIEVLRGPLSALWGNASGGVVRVFTGDGGARPEAAVLSAQWKPLPQWTAIAAPTLLHASHLDSFRTCVAGSPANTATVPRGNHISCTVRRSTYAELA